jgi:hypothetical protein
MLATVYCSGSIQKGSSSHAHALWTDTERAELAAAARPVEVAFLNPDDPASDLSDVAALFGRDMYQVQIADFIVVDARERRGIGIGVEMVASRLLNTPLVVVAPRNSYYRMDSLNYRGSHVTDYVHPHIEILADAVVDTFEEAGHWLKSFLQTPRKTKGPGAIYEAIEAYKTRMLPSDPPMLTLLSALRESRPYPPSSHGVLLSR